MNTNIAAAFRHLGIALIDLEYAILELAQSTCEPDMIDARSAALEDLVEERDRLRELNDQLLAAFNDAHTAGARWTRKWWPHLALASATARCAPPPMDDAAS